MAVKLFRRKYLFMTVAAVLIAGLLASPHLLSWLSGPKPNRVVAWGANSHGQLATGVSDSDLRRPEVSLAEVPGVKQLAAGSNHGLALDDQGRVWAWGDNHYGQSGQDFIRDRIPTPEIVKGPPKVVRIAANQDHSLALSEDGRVWSWGLNMSGQLGTGDNDTSWWPQPVDGISGVQDIAAGYRTSLALKTDGSLWGWGGDCGLADRRDETFRRTIQQIVATGSYSDTDTLHEGEYEARIFVKPEEDCINEDVVGIKSVRPKLIEGLPKLSTISAGFGHMLAIDGEGHVWAWGCNTHGQVGNGTVGRGTGANLRPARVAGMDNVVAASAGYRHSLIMKRDGSLWSWGFNASGALGTGEQADHNPVPARIQGINNVRQISAGHDYSLAVTRDGRLWAWGSGEAGQFDGSDLKRRHPATAWGLEKVDVPVAGGGFALALVR